MSRVLGEQDVTRITHRDSVEDMIRKGRDLERLVLARAVRWVGALSSLSLHVYLALAMCLIM